MSQRLLIVDDNPMSCSAIASIVAGDPDLEVVGEAHDGFEALQLAMALRPDLILMDINMPRCDGLLATRLIKRQLPRTVIVILTVSADAADLFEAVRSGAQGYLPKNLDPQAWLTYLRGFGTEAGAMPREMAGRILSELQVPETRAEDGEIRPTGREAEILRLVARAMTNREIAETLMISEHTVKNHLKHLLQKLHLKNRVDLAVYARRNGS
jgi:DNA-binding NarL/FixJ family response regulator